MRASIGYDRPYRVREKPAIVETRRRRDLDHPGSTRFQVDCAVNIDALTSARLLDRELFLLGRPAADRPRRMGRMHGVREQHGFVVAQGIQEAIIACDEGLLLRFVELARDDVRLVIRQTQAVQQRDQSRAAFVDEAKFLLDPGPDLARRPRQARGDPSLQVVFLRGAHKARAPAHIEAGQAFDAALFKELAPTADRVVVEQQRLGDLPAAPPIIQKHQGVRATRHPTGRRPIARQRDQLVTILFAKEAASNHASIGIRPATKRKEFSRTFNESGYSIPRSRHDPKILWVDDAEIVGDRITKVRPIPRNLFTQKTERRIGELGTSCVALVVSDVSVHEAP